jgi:glycosyltransferase involved in cell wall biosynthesis
MRIALLTTDNRTINKNYSPPAPYFGTAPEALMQGLALMPEVEVHVVSCVRGKVQSPAKLAPNIFFHSLHVPKIGWMSTGYQGCIRASRKKLKEIRPDIVHGQGTEMDCSISAVFSGFPNVLTIHGNMRLIAVVNRARPFSFEWLAARLERLAIPRSDGVVCITHHTRQAVRDLAQRHKFELRFCGPANEHAPYGREFFSLVRARPWCVYNGVTRRAELKALLRQASLLVLPSLEDNCPMSVLEAMAAGVPVVASKVGGLPDLIEEGKTGYFFNPLEAASMAAAIERVLVNPSGAAEVAGQARQRARERFHPEVVARRHLEIYQEALGSRSRGVNKQAPAINS